MHAKSSPFLRTAGLLTGALLALTSPRAAAADPDAFPLFDNYLILAGLAPSVSGDGNAFQVRNWTSKNGAGGIEDFRYSVDPSKGTNLLVDGHALVGTADYLGHFRLSKYEVGSIDIGYQRFRTFYDGVGGFFPTNGQFSSLADPDLHVDRSKFWAEATIALPNAPVFTLKYTNELRDGSKDSTIWGDSDNTGITIWSQSALNVISANRKFIAAYTDLNERHQTLEGSMRHTVGSTTFELAVIGDRVDNLDTRFTNRYPGEVKPFPAIPSNPLTQVPYTLANNWTRGFDAQGIKSDTLSFLGKFETKLSDTVTLHGGITSQHTSADLTGDREITISIATKTGVQNLVGGFTSGGRPPYSYTAVAGTADVTVRAADLGVDLKPIKDLFVTAAVKAEDRSSSASNPVTFINTFVAPTTGATNSVPVTGPNTSEITERSWTPELDMRYTGIRRVSLYATIDYRHAPGDESATGTSVSAVGAAQVASTSSSHDVTAENHLNYKLGFNWTPSAVVSLRGEVFSKSHRNAFYDYGSDTGDRFILGYNFNGIKATATVKPLPTLTSTTRYVLQVGLMDVTAITDGVGGDYDSGDCRSHQIGETIDWTPTKQFYMQGDVNVVFDEIRTSYPRAGGVANTVLHNANNNYWTASAVAGFVVDKNTDAQVQYTYYHADNFQAALAATTMPFGAGVEESTITLGLKHKFSDRLIGSAKIGYFSSKNATTGGFTDYRARLVYLTLDYKI
jgi:hypothetical protein